MRLFVFIALILQSLLSANASDKPARRAPFYQEVNENHDIRFLNTGLVALQKRLDLIEQAQKQIEFEYFIVHADKSTRLLLQALVRKAKQGVKVRVLVDYLFVGTQITPFFIHELEKVGVQVRYYNPVPLASLPSVHYRNHRKLLSVDDQVALVGGRNLRDRYFDLHSEFNYIDRDMVVDGPIVKTIRASFDEFWNSSFSKALPRPKKPHLNDLVYRKGSRLEANRKYREDLFRWNKNEVEAQEFIIESKQDLALKQRVAAATNSDLKNLPGGNCNKLVFASDVPGVGAWAQDRNLRLSSEVTFEWMTSAKTEILKESAFVIINNQTKDLLQEILDRDVNIKIMTNSFYSTDLMLTTSIFFDRASKWIERGISFAAYSGDRMPNHEVFEDMVGESRWGIHSKSSLIDDESFMIGSLNFDPRSFNWSSELVLICYDEKLTGMLKESIEKRWDNSIELQTAESVAKHRFDRVGLLNRLGHYLIKFPASFLDHHL